MIRLIALATITIMVGWCVRGYPAIGAEILIMFVPVVTWAIRVERQREQIWREYQDWETVKEAERRQYLGEVMLKNAKIG